MSRKTPAQERYISALRRGKSKEEAEWTRDNPPGTCRQHPERAAWSPQKRDCEECRKAKRNAAQAKERAKLVTSKCQKCGKEFRSKKYAYRVNCPDCHAGKSAEKKPKAPKPAKVYVAKPLAIAPSKPVEAPKEYRIIERHDQPITVIPPTYRPTLRNYWGDKSGAKWTAADD